MAFSHPSEFAYSKLSKKASYIYVYVCLYMYTVNHGKEFGGNLDGMDKLDWPWIYSKMHSITLQVINCYIIMTNTKWLYTGKDFWPQVSRFSFAIMYCKCTSRHNTNHGKMMHILFGGGAHLNISTKKGVNSAICK